MTAAWMAGLTAVQKVVWMVVGMDELWVVNWVAWLDVTLAVGRVVVSVVLMVVVMDDLWDVCWVASRAAHWAER